MHGRTEKVTDDKPVSYVLERRGGWDEWSDAHWAVTGVMVPGGRELSRFVDATDHYGNPVSIEFPPRRHGVGSITVEWSDPFNMREFDSLAEFNDWAEDHIETFKG